MGSTEVRGKQQAFTFLKKAYDAHSDKPSLCALELGKSLGFDDKASLEIIHYLEAQGFIVRSCAHSSFRLSPAGLDEIAWSLSA